MPVGFLGPFFALILVTLAVNIALYALRIPAMLKAKVNPQDYATRSKKGSLGAGPDAASDNYMNLFEQPVLFYALALYLYASGSADPLALGLAWSYAGARTLHSLIHIAYNRVAQRFLVYWAGTLILMALAVRSLLLAMG